MSEILSLSDWINLSVVVFIMGMSKGGMPVSGIALPLLVILWPEEGNSARSAVSFMLPLLCTMDIIGALFYRGKVDWTHIRKLMPGMFAGVAIASIFFVTDAGLAVSDTVLKLTIGIVGLAFSCFHLFKIPSLFNKNKRLHSFRPPVFGATAGLTSTIAHAAGPVMQMYLLPCNLSKQVFAGTTIYFFLILNGVKLIPFAFFGRFTSDQLSLNIWMLPIIPIGVFTGYALVRIMKRKYYMAFIQFSLAVTSAILIIKAIY